MRLSFRRVRNISYMRLDCKPSEERLAKDILRETLLEYNSKYSNDKIMSETYYSFLVVVSGRKEYDLIRSIYIQTKKRFYEAYRY